MRSSKVISALKTTRPQRGIATLSNASISTLANRLERKSINPVTAHVQVRHVSSSSDVEFPQVKFSPPVEEYLERLRKINKTTALNSIEQKMEKRLLEIGL